MTGGQAVLLTQAIPTRNEAICLAYAAGQRSGSDIGREFGISQQRVRQIAARAGLYRNGVSCPARPRAVHEPKRVSRPCSRCGEIVLPGQMKRHRRAAGHPLYTEQCTRPGCDQPHYVSSTGRSENSWCIKHMSESAARWAARQDPARLAAYGKAWRDRARLRS